MSAEEGSSDFFLTKLPWQVHPDHDEDWFEQETKNMSKREIAQEYLCNKYPLYFIVAIYSLI